MFKHIGMWTWPDATMVEDPTRMAERLATAGIDMNFPYLCSREDGEAKSAFEAKLGALVEAAHRHGQEVHGCFDELNAYPAMPVYHLRQAYKDGTLNNTLCPANPEVIDYNLGELERLLKKFDFDGIGLEDGYVFHHSTIYDPAHTIGVEYRIEPVCYCEYCQSHAPIEKPEWAQWKRDRLSDLVAAQARLIRQLKPGAKFSAAGRLPFQQSFYEPYQADIPYYSGWRYCQARDGFSADWVEWVRQGHLDFVCPMSYHHNDRVVELETIECRHQLPGAQDLAWVGLGLSEVNAEYSQGIPGIDDPENKTYDPALLNDAAAIARQLQIQKDLGQENCMFFSYAFLRDEHIPVIASFQKS